MAKYPKISDSCRSCRLLSTLGIKGGKYDRWCCKYSKPASKAIGHCIINNGYESMEDWKKKWEMMRNG